MKMEHEFYNFDVKHFIGRVALNIDRIELNNKKNSS